MCVCCTSFMLTRVNEHGVDMTSYNVHVHVHVYSLLRQSRLRSCFVHVEKRLCISRELWHGTTSENGCTPSRLPAGRGGGGCGKTQFTVQLGYTNSHKLYVQCTCTCTVYGAQCVLFFTDYKYE